MAVVSAADATAANFTFFDRTFTRQTGQPVTSTVTVVPPAPGPFTLHVETKDLSSAVVTLNGAAILQPSDFSRNKGRSFDLAVTLLATNVLTVELRSAPGSWLRITVGGNDADPPLIRAVITPAPNTRGWNSTGVTVSFQCSDTGSGVATCPPPVQLANEGREQAVTGTAIDRVGNASTARVIVNIDKTIPVIVGHPVPPPNAEGWHRADLVAAFSCDDGLSGIYSCTPPIGMAARGNDGSHDLLGTAVDNAGLTATSVVRVNIDATAPTIVATPDRAPDDAGWYIGPVTVTFACTDERSGIAVCPAPVRIISTGDPVVASGTAFDRAGNSAVANLPLRIRTGIAPGLTATQAPPPNAAGWNNSDVVVSFTCQDNGSGIQACPPPQTVSAEGRHDITASVADLFGTTRTITVSVQIDRTAPSIVATVAPPAGPGGWHAAAATAIFTCADALSGVASCPAPVVISGDGAAQVASGVATDQAGNTATASASVNVDATPPTVRAIVSDPADVANQDVVVTFECLDAGSGVADCPAPVTVTTEGLNQIVTGTAHDVAGNAAAATVTVSLDRTRPTIVAAVSPAANGAGWHNTPVTVTFTCSDTGSTIVSCPDPITVAANAAGQVISGETRDAAGNRSEASVTLNIDTVAPSIAANLSVAANGAGWHRAPTSVRFACADELSTIATCANDIEVTTDGEHNLVGTATDLAGNSASATLVVRLDQVAPVATQSVSPPPNGDGWHNTDVTVGYVCADAGSGVIACPAATIVTAEGERQAIAIEIADRAGNVATAQTIISIDKTPPSIAAAPTPPANGNGWHNTPVTVIFTCSDGLSAISSCTPPVVVATEVADEVVAGIAVDRAGNAASTSVTLNIDTTAPSVTVLPSTTGWTNADVTVTFKCADVGAGVQSCSDAQVVSQEGQTSVSGQVTDRAGNVGTASASVTIDRTAPSIVAHVTPPLTGGFAREAVTVSFTCGDSGSGIADCPSPRVIDTEGIAQVISGTARDAAGNSAETSVTISVDLTPPTIRAVPVPAPNAAGWNNTPVTVTFVCDDTLGEVAGCPAAISLAAEGAGQIVNGNVTDRAGHTASVSLSLNLDFTPPSIAAAVQPPANPLGWHAQPATVSFTCGDALSEVAVCAQPITVSGGAGQAINGTATDRAGNAASASVMVNVDTAAPVVVATVAPPPNAAGWNNTDVTVSFDCADSGAGLVECPAPFTVSTEGANQMFARTVLDRAGNSVVITTRLNIDRTPPVVTITAPLENAVLRSSPIRVLAQLTDALSGIATVTCGSNQFPGAPTLDCERALAPGQNAVVVRATDAAGNEVSASRTVQYEPNREPRAMPGGPYTGVTGSPISFSGAASFDPDSNPLTYAWRFGDDTTGSGPQASHTYANPGTFTLTLTVNDGNGGTNEATTTVTVARANTIPTVRVGGPYATDVGTSLILDAAASTDDDGDSLTATWNFGDGATGTGLTPRYTYRATGVFTATVTITDGHGGSASGSTQVTVRTTNQLPVAQVGGPYRGEVNRPIAFDASASTDPDNEALTFAWTFGDAGAETGPTPSHPFATTGIFPVTVTVTDARGGSSSASTQVTVSATNTIPTAEANGPYTQEAGFPLALSSAGSIDPDGDVLTFTWRFGDGRSNTGPSPSPLYTVAGTYTIELTVDDGKGGRATDSASVTIVPRANEDNRNPIAAAGGPYTVEAGVPIAMNPLGSVDPDGDGLSYAWTFGDGGTSSERAPSYAWAEVGTYPITLTVSDGRGGSAAATAQSIVTAPTDRAPPHVTVLGPTEVLPGTQFTAVAQVADSSAITRVTFEMADGTTTHDEQAPFERAVVIPAVAAPGASLVLRATATDAAGNSGSGELAMTIVVQPDDEAPTVTLHRPPQAAPGSSARLAADVEDNAGVKEVAFLVNDVTVGIDREPPFEMTFAVPANAAVGSILHAAARASDFTGNESQATGDITIVALTDDIPPTLTLSAPAIANPGSTFLVTAVPADNSGISSVQLRVDGVPVGDFTAPPFAVDVPVAAGAAIGSLLRIEGTAIDFSGLDVTASANVRVASPFSAGEGLVLGEVYDDAMGVPLAGARVQLSGQTGSGAPFVAETVSDARGAYVLRVPAGTGRIAVSRDGWTAATRAITIVDGQAQVAIDARLSQYDTSQAISPVLGGTVTAGDLQVRIGPGDLAIAATIQARRLSAQGLHAPLPLGWTPLAAIDLAPANVTFAIGAELIAPVPAGISAGRMLHLVAWDADDSAWRVMATLATPESGTLSTLLTATGQYAWIVGDVIPVSPPISANGELLQGAQVSALPADATAAVTPQPRVIIYEPGVRSDVRTEVPSAQPLSSGTRLQATIQETYHFTNNTSVRLDPFIQDVFFHQSATAAARLQASYPVSTSVPFESLALLEGVIAVDVHEPASSAPAPAIAVTGGVINGDGGVRLDIPSGAVTNLTSAALQPLTAAGLGIMLPTGVTFVGGATVSLTTTLSRSALFSVPRPDGLDPNASLLLVRLGEVGGTTRMLLTGLGRIDGDRVTTVLELPRNAIPLIGVREAGRFAFLAVPAGVAFAFGQVVGTAGGPLAGALVTSDTLAIAALSRTGGSYVGVVRPSVSTLTGLDVARSDIGTARITPASAGDEIAIDLRLQAEPPRITGINPSNNAVNVPPSTAVVVRFSEPLDPASVSGTPIVLESAAGPVDGVLALSEGNTTLTFRPIAELANDTEYTVRIAGVRDLAGNGIAAPFVIRFSSLDTLAPPPPPAGSLQAAIPGADGFTTISGTQGTAGLHDTVFIENVKRGTLTPVLVDQNGGFQTRVAVGLGDRLRLRITDPGGNETIVELPRFSDAQGRVVIGPEGGDIDLPNGFRLSVAEGTFPQGSIVRFIPQTAAQLGAAPTADFPLMGGFAVESSAQPQIYMNVSMPVPAGTPEGEAGIIAEVVEVFGGIPALSIVDSAVVENGRMRTSSPPCPGILTSKFTRYGAYLTPYGKRNLAVSLLNLALPRDVNVVVQPYGIPIHPLMPYPPIMLYPGLEFTDRVNPQSPFINAILSGTKSPTEVFATLEGGVLMPNGQVCSTVGTNNCTQSVRNSCMVVPSDTPMTLVVRNASNGQVINNVNVQTPPAGQVATASRLYIAPGDTQGPGLVGASWGAQPPHVIDLNEPIELRFSEAISFVPVQSGPPLYIEDLDLQQTIQFSRVHISDRSKKLTLTPSKALPMGHRFKIHTPGVADVIGNPFVEPLEFETFKPTIVQNAQGFTFGRTSIESDLSNSLNNFSPGNLHGLGLRDLSFTTTAPGQSLDRLWHTTVTGVRTGFDLAYKLLTFNVDDATRPRARGGLIFGNRSAVATESYRAFRLTPRTIPADAGPLRDALQLWTSRNLYVTPAVPSNRICAAPGDPGLNQWLAAQVIAGRAVTTEGGGCGDLQVTTSYNNLFGLLDIHDVTDPDAPIQIGSRIWNDNGNSLSPPAPRRRWAPQGSAVPKAFVLFPGLDITHEAHGKQFTSTNTTAVYSALTLLGLGMVDLQLNVPPLVDFFERWGENPAGTVVESEASWIFPFYQDVDVLGSRVIAIASDRTDGSGTTHLEVFSPALAPIGQPFPLTGLKPERMWSKEGFLQYDGNGDGVPEAHDAAFVVGATGGLAVIEIPANNTPMLVGFIRTTRAPGSWPSGSGLGDIAFDCSLPCLSHIEVDTTLKVAYIKARWKTDPNAATTEGLLAVDIRAPLGNPVDADADGWDDRLIGLIPLIGPGLTHQQGSVNRFRLDDQRKLIYVAVETEPDVPFLIVRMCQCSELQARLDLRSAGVGQSEFPSTDGDMTTVYVTPADFATGDVRVSVEVEPYTGNSVTYHVTEYPLSGNPADRVLDPLWNANGFVTAGTALIHIPLRTPLGGGAPLPSGSVIAIDFRDSSGAFIKRVNVEFVTRQVIARNAVVRTRLDKTNQRVLATPGTLNFFLPVEARVTISLSAGFVLGDTLLAAGWNSVPVGRELVPEPGEHPYVLTAVFDQGINVVATGTILHDISITESLPIGHTFIKGVDLQDGHLSLSREDVGIPGVGPALSFSRSYSSSGVRATGPMGAGWSHNWEMSLTADDTGTVTVQAGEGGGGKFTNMTPSGQQNVIRFAPQPGYHGVVEFSNDEYDYYTKARYRYHFAKPPSFPNADYLLMWIADPHGNRLTLTYEDGTRLREVKDASGRTLIFTYADYGATPEPRVTRVEGPLNLELAFTYDEVGNLLTATRADRSESYEYSESNPRDRHNIERIVDPNGNATQYTYFAAGDAFPGESAPPFDATRDILVIPEKRELVKTVTEGAGSPQAAATTFVFDYSQHQTKYVTSVTDPRGTTTKYTLNPRGNVVEHRTPTPTGDNVTAMRWAYEDGINDVYMTQRTDPNGRVTRFAYDAGGNTIRETIDTTTVGYPGVANAAGVGVPQVVTEYEFDPLYNRVIRKVDPEGKVTLFTYDPATGDLLTQSSDPLDGSGPYQITYAYTTHQAGSITLRGLLSTVTDPLGRLTRYRAFDQWGNATETVDPLGNVSTNTFDARGRVTAARDTMGRDVVMTHDDLDRVLTTTKRAVRQPAMPGLASADRVTATTYLPGGQSETTTDGNGHVTTYTYDALNRLRGESIDVLDAGGATTTLTAAHRYDGNGNKVGETDRRGIDRVFAFDVLNRLTSITVDGSHVMASYTYDAAGNKTSESDLHGHVTQFEHDALYRVMRTRLPVAPFTLAGDYDLVGNVLRSRDANGGERQFTYDGTYRVLTETDPAGTTHQYTYDKIGNRLTDLNLKNGLLVTAAYDDLNRATSVTQKFTDPLTGSVVSYTTTRAYDDANHEVTITDPRGKVTREVYNGNDALIVSTTDALGLALSRTYSYDGNGNTVAASDPQNGDVDVATTYDALNRPTSQTRPERGTSTSFYDGNGNVVRSVDGRGVTQRFEYDVLDRKTADILVESISNGGADLITSRHEYDDVANIEKEFDAANNPTERQLDALHREVSRTDAQGRTRTMEWDGIERRAEVDERGLRTEYDYDALGRLTATRELGGPGPSLLSSSYDDASGRRTDTDRRGIQTITQVDQLGRVRRLSRRHPSLAAEYGAAEVVLEERAYDGAGNIVEERTARGAIDRHEYDGAGRRVTSTVGFGTPSAEKTTFTYDNAGNLLTTKNPRMHGGAFDMQFTYDAAYRRITETNAAGEVTTYAFDQADHATAITQPKGAQFRTIYSYDETGALLAVDETRAGQGGTTRSVYDERRNRIAAQDASGRLTTYRYDSLNRLTDEFRHPNALPLPTGRDGDVGSGAAGDARHTRYEYDATGNQTAIVDPAGQRVDKTYDFLDRLTTKTYTAHAPGPDGATVYPMLIRSVLEYDASGNPLRAIETKRLSATSGDVTETVTSTYDHLERMAVQTNPDGKVVRNRYNVAGDRLEMTDPDGRITTTVYDILGRLRTVTSANATTTYSYFPGGLQQNVQYPNGVVAAMAYDRANRLTEVRNETSGGVLISRQAYGYDANGNRTQSIEQQSTLAGGASEQVDYVYDALNRLSRVTYGSTGSTEYTYDAAANRLSEHGTNAAGVAVDRTFVYDGLTQLVRVEDAANPNASLTLRYDRNGNTIQRVSGLLQNGTIPAPLSTQTFTFDIRDQLARADALDGTGPVSFDYDIGGRRTRLFTSVFDIRFAYDQSVVVQEYDAASGVTTQNYTWGNGLLALGSATAGGGQDTSYYLLDGLRSTTNLVSETGAVVQSYKYDAWGNVRDRVGTSPNRRTFTSHYEDPETGLQYFGARYYDPGTGRFLSRDAAAGTATDPISGNKYLYAHANPASMVDPTGNAAEPAQDTEPDLSKASTPELLGHWAIGVGKGAMKAIGAPIAGLLKSAVLGLADIGGAGLGYLAMEASGMQHIDEIGTLMAPVSPIGKRAAEVGTLTAIAEAPVGMVKESIESFKTLPARLKAAANSGDPEQMGAAAVEVVQLGQSLKGPAQAMVRKGQQAVITVDILSRQRISKEYKFRPLADMEAIGSLEAQNLLRTKTGTIKPRDAWTLAGACVSGGVSGCGFVGGFSGRSFSNFVDNVKANRSLGRGPLESRMNVFGNPVEDVKYHGDIDFILSKKNTPYRTDASLAMAINRQTSVNFLDTTAKHGVLGEFLPPAMLPAKAQRLWWSQQGLPFGSKIRAQDYWTNGVVGWPGANVPVAPLIKNGNTIARKTESTYFEYRNLSHGVGGTPTSVDFLRLMLFQNAQGHRK